MSETPIADDFDYGDYDLEELVAPVETTEALSYPDAPVNDDGQDEPQDSLLTFTGVGGRTPAEAIAQARTWSRNRHWCGVGMCLATVRQYYGVPSGVSTASQSWAMSDHKRVFRDPTDVPRGVPVYWTGGSSGAGHIAISMGGGLCYSTDWKEAGRIDVARIADITSHWNLDYKGFTWEVNGRQVWAPVPPKDTVHLSNLKHGKRNKEVLRLKRRLHEKGYRGFILSSDKFGDGTRRAYANYQKRLGFGGKAADGIPGTLSLKKLGFRVLP